MPVTSEVFGILQEGEENKFDGAGIGLLSEILMKWKMLKQVKGQGRWQGSWNKTAGKPTYMTH